MDLQLPALLAANGAYQREGFRTAPGTPQPARHLVVLTCMDARLDLFRSLGLEVGDAHILRNAGGRVSTDAIRSLVVSTHLLGTREIGVIHHTNCGLAGVTDEQVARATGVADLDFLAFGDVDESVRADVEALRSYQQFPVATVVWGGVYDVATGGIRLVVKP